MKTLKDFEILDENGNTVQEADLEEFLSDSDFVPFVVEKKRGDGTLVIRKFVLQIDNGKVSVEDLAAYRKAMATIAVDAEEDGESESGEVNAVQVEKFINLTEEMAKFESELLAKLVVDSNYPGKDFSDPTVLREHKGAGPAARKALKSYFFGDTSELEEEIGTTETAPIETQSDSSEATGNSEAIPPTS